MKIIVVRGKSQITDHMFMYQPVDFLMRNPNNISVKVFYFSLEMSKEEKIQQLICRKLYDDHRLIVSPVELASKRKALDSSILTMIDEKQAYFEEFLSHVTFIDDIRNPTGDVL